MCGEHHWYCGVLAILWERSEKMEVREEDEKGEGGGVPLSTVPRNRASG